MKILILYSGGLDSLIMKRFAEVKYPTAEISMVWYDIGQEYAAKELAALPTDVDVLKLDWLTPNQQLESKDSSSGNIFIPGRNLVLACAAACKYLPDEVWLGALQGEIHDKATDKNYQFLGEASRTLSYVLSPYKPNGVKVRFPLAEAGLNKLTATDWAIGNGITRQQILSSSSCLSGEKGNCGHCVVCFRRWGIFKQLGFSETYNVDPLSVKANEDIAYEMLYGSYYDEHRCSEIVPALEDEHEFLERLRIRHEQSNEKT